MKNKIIEFLKYWLPTAIILTMIFFTIYAAVQQSLRQSANDPQIQIAEDTAKALSDGAQFSGSTPTIDIAKSLATFVIVYDVGEKPVLATGYLNNKIPSPPPGVFAFVKRFGEDRVTWEPEKGVRVATVMTYFENATSSGYVWAGRSLREVENRVERLGIIVLLPWLASLLFSGLAIFFLQQKNDWFGRFIRKMPFISRRPRP